MIKTEENITMFKTLEVFDSININDETKERLKNLTVKDLEVRVYTYDLNLLSKNMRKPYETIKSILKLENIQVTTDDIKIFLHPREELKDILKDILEDGDEPEYDGYMLFKTQRTWYSF